MRIELNEANTQKVLEASGPQATDRSPTQVINLLVDAMDLIEIQQVVKLKMNSNPVPHHQRPKTIRRSGATRWTIRRVQPPSP
ncbi:MAG: hypothetical protein WBW16_01685 [Bacteroidota bacterium]